MKKIIIAIIAMFATTMSVDAQSNDNNRLTFDRLSSYLELTINQMEPVKTAMAQFNCSMEAYKQMDDASKGAKAWEKILARHKMNM